MAAKQQALLLADLSEWRRQRFKVVAPVQPIGGLPYIGVIAAIYAVIVRKNRRIADAGAGRLSDPSSAIHST